MISSAAKAGNVNQRVRSERAVSLEQTVSVGTALTRLAAMSLRALFMRSALRALAVACQGIRVRTVTIARQDFIRTTRVLSVSQTNRLGNLARQVLSVGVGLSASMDSAAYSQPVAVHPLRVPAHLRPRQVEKVP